MTDAPKRIWTDYSVGLYGHIIDHKNPGHSWDRDATLYVRADIADEMLDAIKEFCCRVEVGEIRSKKTYAKFTAIIDKVESEDT